MNTFDESYEDVTLTVGGRRKRADKTQHAKEVAKRARHSSGGKVPTTGCTHTSEKGCCLAEMLTAADLAMNMEKFYASANKVEQDAYLLRLIRVEKPKRLRTKEEDRKRSRNNMNSFYLLTSQGHGQLRVCKATFCSVLGISLDRVIRVAKHFGEHKEARPEGKGGRRMVELDQEKRNAVIGHIQSFKCKASHYARKDSPGRKYLPHEVCVAKMYRMFREQNHLQVSYSLYHSVFSHNFNLGFDSPATDVCATCTQFKHQVCNNELSEDDKKIMAAEFILHRRRQRHFYDMMNRVGDTTTVCFDMMQNLVLPRTPIGQAYYSRQLYLHVFGVVVHRADGSQKKEDIHLFTWLESEKGKDSNMIASALWHFLRTVLKDELTTRSELRLFSDSCYGQNKNMNVLSMLMAFRKQECPHLTVTYTFPIRGHSFLPADRVFGRVEQEIRKNPTILLPDQYLDILSHHGQVHRYGADWESLDFKAAASKCLKKTKTFKISEVRMMEIKGSAVGVKDTYSANFTVHNILKKGCSWDNFKPELLPKSSHVKPAKREDTLKLLTELKAPQHVVDWYNKTLGDGPIVDNSSDEDSD